MEDNRTVKGYREIQAENGLWGVADPNGNLIIPCNYEGVEPLDFYSNNDYITIGYADKYCLINVATNRIVIESAFDIPLYCGESMFTYCNEKRKYGVIDVSNNKIIIPCEYDRWIIPLSAEDMSGVGYETMIEVEKYNWAECPGWDRESWKENLNEIVFGCIDNGKIGVKNTRNEWVVPCRYDKIGVIRNRIVEVSLNGLRGLVEYETGREIQPCIFTEIYHPTGYDYFRAIKSDGTNVLIDENTGETI